MLFVRMFLIVWIVSMMERKKFVMECCKGLRILDQEPLNVLRIAVSANWIGNCFGKCC